MADFTDQFVVEEDVGADIRVNKAKGSWADDTEGLHGTFMKVAGSPPSRKGLPGKGDIEELDAHKLAQRQKQIDFGRNTIGYQRYVQLVPRAHRRKVDPATPDIHQRISKRCFDGQVKAWRRMLHAYDDPSCGPQGNRPAAAQHSSRRQQQQEESEDFDQQQRGGSVASGSPAVSDRPSQTSLDGYMDPAVRVGTKRDREHAFAAGDSGQQHNGSGASTATADPAAAAAAAAAAVLCGDADADDELASREPDAKRSTASRSMDVSLPARDGSSSAAGVGPTSFAGIGLASKLAGGSAAQPAAAAMPPPPAPPSRAQGAAADGAAAQPAPRKLRDPDNVVSLILGEDSRSCMSWQQQDDDELSNIGL